MTPSSADERALPPLPKPDLWRKDDGFQGYTAKPEAGPWFDGRSMRAYVLADRASLGAAQVPADVYCVNQADCEPFQHPQYGPGIFFTEDCIRSELPSAGAAQVPALSDEHRRAILEGERIAAADTYFRLRHPMLDTTANRNTFDAGFDRGYNAAAAGSAPVLSLSDAQIEAEAARVFAGPNWKYERSVFCRGARFAIAALSQPSQQGQGS